VTARERLGRTQRALVAATLLRALLVGAAAVVVLLVVIGAVDLIVPIPRIVRDAGRFFAILVAVIAAAIALVPLQRVRTRARVALWIEEHVPALRYALVTLAGDAAPVNAPQLEAQVARVEWEGVVRQAMTRRLMIPAAAMLVAGALLFILPASTLARVATPAEGDSLERRGLGSDEVRSTIATVVATITPPAYTGAARRTVEEPASIEAPVGSRIELRGRGLATRVGIDVDGASMTVGASDDGWRVVVPVSARPFAIRLRDDVANDERLIAVEPQADGPPRVTLASPARDTVMRVAAGRVPLEVDVVDDYGVVSVRFEWIVSAGEGENFEFRSGSVAFAGGNARTRRATASLSLDSLALTPGSMVHVRAVARDGNTVTGPGQGVSETRLLRVARASEYDSIAIEGIAPPEGDSSALSQRMLIMMTEALEKRRPRLDRQTHLREATAIGRDQVRLRKRVGEIVFQRLSGEDSGEHSHEDLTPEQLMAHAAAESGMGPPGEGDEAPVIAINQPLLEAYNAMWEAQTHLLLGETREALPPMYRALEAIQRARAAERLYLRGRPAQVVVDLAKVRLAGQRPDSAGARTARPLPARELALQSRFERALVVASRDARAAADSLMLLRLAVIGEGDDARPAFAAALAEAAARLRGDDDVAAEEALRRARRMLAGEPRRTAGLPQWSGGW